jgi:hypothetical protein
MRHVVLAFLLLVWMLLTVGLTLSLIGIIVIACSDWDEIPEMLFKHFKQ